jgi:hypothetical protein
VRDLLKRTGLAASRRIWGSLAGRCLLGDAAAHTGHGDLLAQLAQAVRGELAADAAQLRSLLIPGHQAQ